MIKPLRAAALALALLAPAATAAQDKPKPPTAQMLAFEKSLIKRTGDVAILPAKARLRLGEEYYFLKAVDAKRVLIEMWGNPPASVGDVLGLVLPAGATSYANVWGAVVTYDASGHVSNDDASKQDFDDALTAMRSGEEEGNAARRKQGYAAVHLVGWAQAPSYDPARHSLVWARDIRFEGEREDTLNYDVRLLGRNGVLSLNMVSTMPHLADVRAAAADFASTADFSPGARYADFNPSTDTSAGYGLAGLVAAGAGVALAKKAGILAIMLGFGKKLILLIALAGAFVWRKVKAMFGTKETDQDDFVAAPLDTDDGADAPAPEAVAPAKSDRTD